MCTGHRSTRDKARKAKRIAHLSDVHMLEERAAGSKHDFSVRFVSVGRPLDARGRAKKLREGLRAAHRAQADHVVITGDLTEVGSQDQFEAFAQVLAGSGFDPDQITLVPGNHDAYTSGEAWKRALEGPLRPYANGSANEPGRVVDLGELVILPNDVSRYQSIARSSGELTPECADALERRLSDPGLSQKVLVVVQHHQPFAHARRLWQWIDGLRGHARLMDILTRHRRVNLLHGHLHRVVDRIAGLGKSRIFGAPAIVDDKDGEPRVRLYEVRDGGLEALGLCPA